MEFGMQAWPSCKLNFRVVPLALLAFLLGSGCTHSINYKLTEADRWQGTKTDRVLHLSPLVDKTSPAHSHSHEKGDHWRVNLRERYANKEIANGVTAMVARHLDHSRLFKKVVVSTNAVGADILLGGEITEYFSTAKVNSTAEGVAAGAAGFGLIGAIVTSTTTAGSKSEVRSNVGFGNLQLLKAADSRLIWSGSVNVSTNFTAHWRAADQRIVLMQADDSLKEAVNELIRKLSEVISSK